jgi:hypothetical protein
MEYVRGVQAISQLQQGPVLRLSFFTGADAEEQIQWPLGHSRRRARVEAGGPDPPMQVDRSNLAVDSARRRMRR